MKVSLIVDTNDKSISLFFLLYSILRQTLKEIEVIIINNCSKNNRIITFFINKAKMPIIVINEETPNKYNEAVNMTSGYYIMFLSCSNYLKKNALELMYNSANNTDVLLTSGYKSYFGICFKSDFSINTGNNIYYEIKENNKLFKRSVLIDNPFQLSSKMSNIPVILYNYKVRSVKYPVVYSRIHLKSLFSRDNNLLEITEVLDYLGSHLSPREFKNIAIMEILYRLENYFYSRNRDEEVKSKLKDYLYLIDNYWFDYEIIKIIMKEDILFRYFMNHAHL